MATRQKVNYVPMEDLLSQVKSWRCLSGKTLNDLLDAVEEHKPSRVTAEAPGNAKRFFVLLACTVALLLCGSVGISRPAKRIASRLLGAGDNGKCLIPMPVDPKNTFRPPVDCAFCRNVFKVDIVDHITPNEFEFKYAYTGRPVLVKDALTNWTATSVFRYEYFRELYLAGSTSSRGGRSRRCQFFPYKTEFHSLAEALSMNDERRLRPWYFGWSNCDSETADALRRHYAKPYFLPERSELSRTDWIFMGTSGFGAHLHVDHVSLPSWQAQVRGTKLWILEPPPECFYECQPMEVLVQAGDTIVLDTNIWYHKTNVVSDEISITIGSEYD